MILTLKSLNEFVAYQHFKMDNIQTALKLMRPKCFMASVDLKDAYYSEPIALEDRKFLSPPLCTTMNIASFSTSMDFGGAAIHSISTQALSLNVMLLARLTKLCLGLMPTHASIMLTAKHNLAGLFATNLTPCRAAIGQTAAKLLLSTRLSHGKLLLTPPTTRASNHDTHSTQVTLHPSLLSTNIDA